MSSWSEEIGFSNSITFGDDELHVFITCFFPIRVNSTSDIKCTEECKLCFYQSLFRTDFFNITFHS